MYYRLQLPPCLCRATLISESEAELIGASPSSRVVVASTPRVQVRSPAAVATEVSCPCGCEQGIPPAAVARAEPRGQPHSCRGRQVWRCRRARRPVSLSCIRSGISADPSIVRSAVTRRPASPLSRSHGVSPGGSRRRRSCTANLVASTCVVVRSRPTRCEELELGPASRPSVSSASVGIMIVSAPQRESPEGSWSTNIRLQLIRTGVVSDARRPANLTVAQTR